MKTLKVKPSIEIVKINKELESKESKIEEVRKRITERVEKGGLGNDSKEELKEFIRQEFNSLRIDIIKELEHQKFDIIKQMDKLITKRINQ